MRRFGEPKIEGQVYRARPGVYAILPSNGWLLLTFQGGMYQEIQLPGGGIDPGEAPIPALHREVFEETGWRIADARLINIYRRYAYMPEYDMWAEKICRIYLARPIRRLGPPTEPDHAEVWMSPAEAAVALASEGDRAVLSTLAPSK